MHDLYKQFMKYGMDKPGNIYKRLQTISDNRLTSFLQEYKEASEKRPLVMQAQYGATDIFPDSRANPLPHDIIRQLAIYARRIYIHDPILWMANEWLNIDSIMYLVIESPDREDRIAKFRHQLAKEIAKLLILQPLVEAEIVHVTPAIYTDDFYGIDKSSNDTLGEHKVIQDLPTAFSKYCRNYLQVKQAKYVDNEPITLLNEQLSPCNMIAVGFPDETKKIYHLLSIEPDPDYDREEGRIRMRFDLSGKEPVNPTMFDNWVSGSKYDFVANEVLSRLQNDLNLAAMAQAKFTTNLQSSTNLALLSLADNPAKPSDRVTSALLKFELPFFENAEFASIAKARKNEAAFAEFEFAMNKAFSEIKDLPHTQEFQKKVEEIYGDLLVAPLANISRQINILRRSLFLDALILVGSLSATFITQGNNLVTAAALLAAVKVVEMYKLDKAKEDEIKQLPSFFYWDATQKSNRKK